MARPVARCFLGLGVPIVQGYGMTEAAPVVAVNTPDDNDPAKVGRALAGIEVRIGELTRDFPRYARPRSVVLSLEAWTVENALVTPTLKLKRNFSAHFATEIEKLYLG